MLKKSFKSIFFSGVVAVLIWPARILAAEADSVTLGNPLQEGKSQAISTGELFGRIIQAMLGVRSIALVMFVYGGFLWLTSGGSADKIKKGRETLVWAILGLVVVFTSYIILSYVLTAITTATK
jgi:hypothetical protein